MPLSKSARALRVSGSFAGGCCARATLAIIITTANRRVRLRIVAIVTRLRCGRMLEGLRSFWRENERHWRAYLRLIPVAFGSSRSRRRSSPGQSSAAPAPRVTACAWASAVAMMAGSTSIKAPSASVPPDSARIWIVARRLEQVHRQERVGDVAADREQAVVAQHQEGLVAEVGDEARLLVVAQRHAFVVVVAEATRARRSTAARSAARRAFCAETATPFSVCVCRTHCASSRAAWIGAVDDEAGRVDRKGRVLQHFLPSRSIFTRLDAVISSNIRPYGLIRKCARAPERAP